MAKIEAQDDNGRTPLSYAAANGHSTVVKLLLEIGKVRADEHWISRTPWPLSLLLTSKVCVDRRDSKGRTPLSYAAANGHASVVKLLLETGKVRAEREDRKGRTPLWYARNNGHEVVVGLLRP
jgi:ankyrin repeat protein